MFVPVECSTQSTQTNKSRLRLLQRREEHLQDLFETARESVSKLAEDEGRYQQLLEGLILQVSFCLTAVEFAECSL